MQDSSEILRLRGRGFAGRSRCVCLAFALFSGAALSVLLAATKDSVNYGSSAVPPPLLPPPPARPLFDEEDGNFPLMAIPLGDVSAPAPAAAAEEEAATTVTASAAPAAEEEAATTVTASAAAAAEEEAATTVTASAATAEEPAAAAIAPESEISEAEQAVPFTERDAPEDMVIDELGLLQTESRKRLSAMLSYFRDTKEIFLYAVATKSFPEAEDEADGLSLLSARWSEDAIIHGVVLFAPERFLPVVSLGGEIPESVQGNYLRLVVADALSRGGCYHTNADVFRACAQEILEEMEILKNRFHYLQNGRNEGSQVSGEPLLEVIPANEGKIAALKRKMKVLIRRGGLPAWRLFLFFIGILLLGLLGVGFSYFSKRKAEASHGQKKPRLEDRLGKIHEESGLEAESIYAAYNARNSDAQTSPSEFPGASFGDAVLGKLGPHEIAARSAQSSVAAVFSFPEIQPDIRFQSPFGGGNNIVVNLHAKMPPAAERSSAEPISGSNPERHGRGASRRLRKSSQHAATEDRKEAGDDEFIY